MDNWCIIVVNKNQQATFASSHGVAHAKITDESKLQGIHYMKVRFFVEDWDNQPQFIKDAAYILTTTPYSEIIYL